MLKTSMRTHTCNELTKKDVGKKVTLCGFCHTIRNHGGVVFIDLRDRYGLTQIVFDPQHSKETHKEADKLRREFVISITGVVKQRKKGMENSNLKTGEIEVFVEKLEIIGPADTPPIEIDDRIVANDEVRLKYRYLDLRRPIMQNNLLLRHKAAQAVREYLNSQEFLEIETPLLIRSTPEGARDYVVPSRVNPGKFYALPQSPQLYKQILMIAGFDRYYQLARCLRDEDLRTDRQPEFTQIDIEMSFVNQNDVMEAVENTIKYAFEKVLGEKFKEKFRVMSYNDSMNKYGTDKPDLRFGLELANVTDAVKNSDFSVFKEVIKNKGMVKALYVEKDFSRTELEQFTEFCISNGAKGLAYMKSDGKKLESNIVKYFSDKIQKDLIQTTKAKKGYIFFIADKTKIVNSVLSKLRDLVAEKLNLINKKEFSFVWIVDFPLFEWNEDEEKWDPAHHMFTMPKKEHIKFLETDPGKVYADLYDLVLNGIEIGSGSIRINNPELQERVMKVVGFDKEKARKRFGFLIDAYRFGGPVHGGFAVGFDRLVSLMGGSNDIREFLAFPKNKNAESPMDNCPNEITNEQLKELNIKLDFVKKN